MPVPATLDEGSIRSFFATWRASGHSLNELGDMVEAVGVQAARLGNQGAATAVGTVEVSIAPEVLGTLNDLTLRLDALEGRLKGSEGQVGVTDVTLQSTGVDKALLTELVEKSVSVYFGSQSVPQIHRTTSPKKPATKKPTARR